MSEINVFDIFANKPYDVVIKSKDNERYIQYSLKYKQDAVAIAKRLLNYFIYSEVVYRPTNEIIWRSKDSMYDIVTIRKGQTIKLSDDYILNDLECALVNHYPIIDGQNCMIVGNNKSTCKELIKSKAEKDLKYLNDILSEVTLFINKIKEIIGE